MALKLKITQIRSGINRPERQKRTLRGLGLTKLHKSVVLPDTPAVRGMVRKISHLVLVEPGE
jgi:large subunit ribosomal protein L30